MRALAWVVVMGWAAVALGDPKTTVRLSTVAPDGTAWAREMRAFARDVEAETGGDVQVKWYFGGIAGDELEVEERMRRGQLDGAASGGMFCLPHSPTMRALRVMGLVQTADEAALILSRMRDRIEEEFAAGGYQLLGTPVLGTDLLFANRAPADLDDLRRMKLWRWELDDPGIRFSRAVGLDIVPMPLAGVSRALDERRLDGVLAVPTAALAFQWAPRVKVLMRLPLGVLGGCLVMTQRTFSRLTIDQQRIIRSSTAKAMLRFLDLQRRQDEALLGSLFEKQGLRVVAPPETLRSQYFAAVRASRDTIASQIVPKDTLARILELLADYRAEHRR